MRIAPLEVEIMFDSNPPKSIILAQRLAVVRIMRGLIVLIVVIVINTSNNTKYYTNTNTNNRGSNAGPSAEDSSPGAPGPESKSREVWGSTQSRF